MIVVADRLPETVRPGDELALDVHVVSDLRTPIEGAEVEAERHRHEQAEPEVLPAQDAKQVRFQAHHDPIGSRHTIRTRQGFPGGATPPPVVEAGKTRRKAATTHSAARLDGRPPGEVQ